MNIKRQPLVSIILPTYNRATLLPKAITSILTQTHRHLELIVIDDNSIDNTQEIIHSFNDPRIQYYKNSTNLKLPRALNHGFSKAKGDYLTWTSDDNVFSTEAIEKMLATLEESNKDFVYADYFLFSDLDSKGQPLNPYQINQSSELQLEKGNHIGACFMYSRKIYEYIGDYDPDLILVEDYDYFIRIAKHFSFIHLPEPLYYFRRDDNTLYCSRYSEVKASDVLVRFKYQLITQQQALDIVTDLITISLINNKKHGLSHLYHFANTFSYRLSQLILQIIHYKIRRQLRHSLFKTLDKYNNMQLNFQEARTLLCTLLQHFGTIEYQPPS
ncbi:MAG: glycosyltransferase [Methylomarinum sp.]|nr:glycosyltransferase [Methylomarinum sp.]